tara:strand:+ start:61 stop:930 length:870 start_codon:yes stop_codon:yes gene_type:complete
MSYIGLPPKATFSSGLLDRFTSTTGTTVTLTHDISSENDIVVFVNFVKQDSTTYSVGGTGNKTLTLGGTLVSSDIVEVHYLIIVGQTVAPSSGSVTTTTINDNAVTGAKLNTDIISAQTELASGVASTDELLISDAGVLKRVDVSLVGGNNTPAFEATAPDNQTYSDATQTTIPANTEVFDTDSAYNNSNYRFTPQVAGKYLCYTEISGTGSSDTLRHVYISIRKNSSDNYLSTATGGLNFSAIGITKVIVLDLNGSSDYVESQVYIDQGSGTPKSLYARIGAFKLIGA